MPRTSQITIDGIPIEVTKKRVKYLRIKVNRSNGKVRISSPWLVRQSVIRKFAESKIDWVKKHLYQSGERKPAPVLNFEMGEKHLIWGNKYTLSVTEKNAKPGVSLNGSGIIQMNIRPQSSREVREKVLREWYRDEIKKEIPGLVKKWEPVMNVKVRDWGVKKMKTRWGTCNTRAKRIWLNLELVKHPPEILEYIVVHEMNHLLERLHSKRFYQLMDQFMPNWREADKKLDGKHWRK